LLRELAVAAKPVAADAPVGELEAAKFELAGQPAETPGRGGG